MTDKKYWEEVVRKGAMTNKPQTIGNLELNPFPIFIMDTISKQLRSNSWKLDHNGVAIGQPKSDEADEKLAFMVTASRNNYGLRITVLNYRDELAVSAGPDRLPEPLFDTLIFKTNEHGMMMFNQLMISIEKLATSECGDDKYV